MSEVKIVRNNFQVRTEIAEALVWLDLARFSQPLRMGVSIDTLTEFDRTTNLRWDGAEKHTDYERLTWTAQSTLWRKQYYLDIYAGHLEFHAQVEGNGEIDCIRFFDSISNFAFREHFSLTKHFNDKWYTNAKVYSKGSPTAFDWVFCPEANSYARQFFRPYEYSQISANSDLDYCGGNFIANPGLLCFVVTDAHKQEWLTFGLAVEPGEYLFSEYEYLGGQEFALNLSIWGARHIENVLRTPRIVMVTGNSVEEALERYVNVLHLGGFVPRPSRQQPSWWYRPIVCGWGHQCYQADIFRIRSCPERQPDNAAYILSTETNYYDILERLDSHNIPWGTLIIDARWFLTGGLKDVDKGRWPNLRNFVDVLHRKNRKVLLWWGPWDTEGIPAEECIRYSPDNFLAKKNRPGRFAKFGIPNLGKKLAVDITLPSVKNRIREQIRVLLSPDGFDIDGFKLDHLAAVPGIYGMHFPEGSGKSFGIEAVRECLALLYETAKNIKSDAMLIGQSPNPYLSDVQDVLRLGDIYTHNPDSVVSEMRFRATMALIANSSWLIDTDGWPMPSLRAFREYMMFQPIIGIPSLYYSTHLDTTGEALTEDDYNRLREAWTVL